LDENLYNCCRIDKGYGRSRVGRYRMSYLRIEKSYSDRKGRKLNRLLKMGFIQSLVKI
jgi:hypothetical protein